MAYIPASNSVVAFQSDPTKLQVTASVAGNVNVSGSVVAMQGTIPWVDAIQGSVATVIIGGSIATATTNSSVMLLNSANTVGSITAYQGVKPWDVAGSVVAFVNGTVPVNAAGSVVAFQGTSPWVVNFQNSSVIAVPTGSVVNLNIGSVITVFKDSSLIGVPSGTQNVSGSVVAFVSGTVPVNAAGSVVAFQGTSPWVVNFQNSSILATPVGSTITIQQANSIVGTYAEDAASASADKGIFILGVRNDTVSSLTSADGDYGARAIDSMGRSVIKPFSPEESTFHYQGSVVSASVTLIKASAIGKKNFITDFFVANTGSVAQLVTFQGGDTSLVGFTIAPAGGGSNAPGIASPMNSNVSQDLAYKVTGTSSVVYVTVNGYQGP